MQLAESHTDTQVTLSSGIAMGKTIVQKLVGKRAHLKCLLLTKLSGVVTRDLNSGESTTLSSMMRYLSLASQVTSALGSGITGVLLETVLARLLFFS